MLPRSAAGRKRLAGVAAVRGATEVSRRRRVQAAAQRARCTAAPPPYTAESWLWESSGVGGGVQLDVSDVEELYQRNERATGWRRLIGSPKLQIIFHKRATKYTSLLRKMTYKDKGSYEASPPCRCEPCGGAISKK